MAAPPAQVYGFAKLGRFGLGHRLLAWARCVIWCNSNGAEMLSPDWFRIPLGPWLRRERDKRLYFFLFRPNAYIHGLRRLYLLMTLKHVDALSVDRTRLADEAQIVSFKNASGGDADKFFPTFLGHHELLRRELTRMTRRRFLPEPMLTPHIAIHVRLGDFATVNVQQLKDGTHSARLPIEWYVEMLQGIRERLSIEVPAIIYSDGASSDLQPLLKLTGVSRAPDRPAITHMLSIAQANLLIGTGSGMSIWGSFLGQVPRLCFPGQRLLRAFSEDGFEPECESRRDIPLAFVDAIRSRFVSRQ